MGLLAIHCPDDEYDSEIYEVCKLFEKAHTVEKLAQGIKDIFEDWFGTNSFKKSYEECLNIAEKILEL